MIEFTTVVAVDAAHVRELQIVWPTWVRHRPEIMRSPLLIIVDGAAGSLEDWEDRLQFVEHPARRIRLWDQEGVSQREKMLTALTILPGMDVDTEWYLKLDTDVVATGPADWLREEWFAPGDEGSEPVFVSNPWGYTKPADAIERLDRWANMQPEFSGTQPLGLSPNPGESLVSHPRIISWCFFGRTKWTREVTTCCCGQLPIPSQDTYLWYCAERRGDFYRRVSMKKFGWAHASQPRRLERLASRSLAAASTNSSLTVPGELPSRAPAPSRGAVAEASEGVVYLLTGPSHAARLVVSLASLRQHYDGPVVLFTTQPESHAIGQMIVDDERLRVIHRPIEPPYKGRNASYLTKVAVLEHTPFEKTLFLDADTVIVDEVRPLFEFTEQTQIIATSFAGWRSDRNPVRSRIEGWRKMSVPSFLGMSWDTLLDSAQNGHPAINTGVFAVRRDAEAIRLWRSLAVLGRQQFICDEIALQLLLHHIPHRLLDDRWNCSPRHGKSRDQVHVWHLHGDKHLSPRGRNLWWPRYQTAIAENLANIRHWTPAGDRELQQLLETEMSVASAVIGER